MKQFLFSLISLILPYNAQAEYRAFQYIVKSADPYAIATKANAQYIVSTLNPQTYQRFHGGSLVTIDLLRTWICPGYTGRNLPICHHPYDQNKEARL